MAFLLRTLKLRTCFISSIMSKNIATSTKALNDAVEELKTNPYYDKYASKIAKLQDVSPEEFLSRVECSKAALKAKETKDKVKPGLTPGTSKPLIEPRAQFTKTKKLSDIMKTELLADKTADEIRQLWLDYHKDKDVIAAVIPKEIYELIFKKGQEFTTFLLPLPRNQGYEFIVLQFYGNEIHFTPLIAYQTHKENAPECLTMIHYPELAESKGIVLMKGDYNTDILQVQEAQCLINEMQLYYGQCNEKRLKILHRFTYAPDEFKHMDLISEVECLTI